MSDITEGFDGLQPAPPTDQEQQKQAADARQTMERLPRQRKVPEYAWMGDTKPPTVPGNPAEMDDEQLRNHYLTGPVDNGVALLERRRLNRQDAYYRGTLAGSLNLAMMANIYKSEDGPDVTPDRKKANDDIRKQYGEVISDLAAHDEMPGFGTTLEAASSLWGQLEGSIVSPESWIGWAAKGSTWLTRTALSGAQQAAVSLGTDPAIQALSIAGGGQQSYEWARTALAPLMGFGIGGGAHLIGEGLGHAIGQHALKKQLFDLGKEDPAFTSSDHAIWALDPDNGINLPNDALGPRRKSGEQILYENAKAPDVEEMIRQGKTPDAAWKTREDFDRKRRIEQSKETYGEGPPESFNDVLKAEREKLAKGYGAAQPKAGQLNEDAKFSAFNKEAQKDLGEILDTYGVDPKVADDLWRFYKRDAGQPVPDAIGEAVDTWAKYHERRAMQSLHLDEEWVAEMKYLDAAFAKEEWRGGGSHTDWRSNETEFPELGRYWRNDAQERAYQERVQNAGRRRDEPGGGTQPGQGAGAGEGGGRAEAGGEPGGQRPAAEGGRREAGPDAEEVAGQIGRTYNVGVGENAHTLRYIWNDAEKTMERHGQYADGHTFVDRLYEAEGVRNWYEGDGEGTHVHFKDRAEAEAQIARDATKFDEVTANNQKAIDNRKAAEQVDLPEAPDRLKDLDRQDRIARGEETPPLAEAPERIKELDRRDAAAEHTPSDAAIRMRAEVGDDAIQRLIDTYYVKADAMDEVAAFYKRGPNETPQSALDRAFEKWMMRGDALSPMDRAANSTEELYAIAQRRKGGRLGDEQARPKQSKAASPDELTPDRERAVQSLQKQGEALVKALGIDLRQGRINMKNALGIYKHSGIIRVKEVADFEVVAHEAGHAIEAKVGQLLTHLTNLHAIELAPMVSNSAAYKPAQYVTEGFAEFIRRYVGSPANAQKVAPNFFAAFEPFMQKKAPEVLQLLQEAQKTYRAYLDASGVDAIGSIVTHVADNPRGIGKARAIWAEKGLPGVIKTAVQESYTGLMDEYAPMTRFVRDMGVAIRTRQGGALVKLEAADNPDVLIRLWERSRQASVRDLMDGPREYHSLKISAPGMAAALTEALGEASVWGKWGEGLTKDFATYLVAKRAEFLWREFAAGNMPNPPVAFSRADAIQAMKDLTAVNPKFAKAAEMVHDYTKAMLKKAHDGGLIDADLYGKLIAQEFYVPFNRSMTDKPAHGSSHATGAEGPGTTEIVRGIRGSSRDIINPIESIMMQTFMVNRTLAHNDIVLSMRNLARRAGREGGKFVEDIPPTELKKYTFDLEEAIERRAREIGMDPADAQLMISALGDPTSADPVMGSYFKMERTTSKGEPILFYREGGQVKAVRLMAGEEGHALYEMLTAAPEPVRDIFVTLAQGAATVKRAGIVTSPTFIITNYFRDQIAASILRPDYVPVIAGLRGLKDEFLQGQNAVLYGYAGGVAGGASIGPVERASEAEINAMAKRGYLVNRLTSFKGVMEFASMTEAGTRNSIFGTVFEKAKKRGLSDYEAMIEAAFEAQDLLDFSRHGSHTMTIARLIPFLNAHIQGLDKARRVFFDPLFRELKATGGTGKVFEKDTADFNNMLQAWFKFAGVGAGLGAVWAAINMDKEAYRDASPYFKGTHLVIPFGNKIGIMPKPFELGTGFTAGEYAVHALYQKDPRAFTQFAEAAWESIKPPNPLTDIPPVSTAIEIKLGRSLFTGRDIVPERLQRLPSVMQFDDRTSEMAKWLARQTEKVGVPMSPIKIEYAIGAQFGTWGRDVMALGQGVSEDAPAAALDDAFFARRFVKDPTRSSETTKAFWDFMSAKTGRFNQGVENYKELVRQAQIKGTPMTAAEDLLAKMPAAERAYVTLKEGAKENGKPAFGADEKRLHPLQRAYDAVQLLADVRRELASNTLSTFGDRSAVPLNPEQRRDLLQNIRMLGQMEMRNAFVITGEKGYEGRPMYEPGDVLELIRNISPTTANEIATRYATAKIYSTNAVRQAWPRLRDELVRYGSQADIRSLAGDAKSEGYEFGGDRVRKPGVRRAPIAGADARP